MASSPLKRFFFTFLLALAISSPDVLARDSQAFSKFLPSETPAEAVVIPEDSPAVQVVKAARFSRDFPTTTAAASTTVNSKYAHSYSTNGDGARYNPDVFASRFADNELYSKNVNYDNKGYSNEGQQSYNYNTNSGGYRNKVSPMTYYPNNAYSNEGYGMSDTRFLEGGRYRYDVNSGKGYGAYAGIGVHDNYRHTATGRKGNAYEYSNEIEGNRNNQENQDEEYVP